MASPELSIMVGELLGVPRVRLSGQMGSWHDQSVLGILQSLRDRGVTSCVFDIVGLVPSGSEGATGLIRILRSLGPSMCVHIVASESVSAILSKAGFSPSIKLYSSTDEIAAHVNSEEEYLTSRWMASGSQDTELPMAA